MERYINKTIKGAVFAVPLPKNMQTWAGFCVNVLCYRLGAKKDKNGCTNITDAYAGLGLVVDEKEKYTGQLLFIAGHNNFPGKTLQAITPNVFNETNGEGLEKNEELLQNWLGEWNIEWQAYFNEHSLYGEKLYRYNPDYIVTPGEVLKEYLDAFKLTPEEFALKAGMCVDCFIKVINAQAPITADLALQLHKIFRRPVHFWLNLEEHYQTDLKNVKPGEG